MLRCVDHISVMEREKREHIPLVQSPSLEISAKWRWICNNLTQHIKDKLHKTLLLRKTRENVASGSETRLRLLSNRATLCGEVLQSIP